MTVAEALAQAVERLRAAGVESPEHDAELLLRHVLGWDRARLVVEAGACLSSDHEAGFRSLVEERTRRRPLQHLTGRQWFWKHEFVVTADVLIPRPETELLVEASLERLRGLSRPVIIDVGTGSGCIALSLAAERPDAEVHATDLSAAALAVAHENARRLGLEGRIAFHHGDLLEPLADLAGRVDLIASNPPYVDPGGPDALAPEVRDHEPAVALFPPGEALWVYRRLVPAARTLLKPGGWLALEIGQGTGPAVAGLCRAAALDVDRILDDLRGIPRVLVARARTKGSLAPPGTRA
jgi:release factor glutamine methyltransferase